MRRYRVRNQHFHFASWVTALLQEVLILCLVVLVFAVPVGASTRFTERGLYMSSARPDDVATWTFKLRYITPTPVGSLDLLFCVSPIPYEPCVTPAGLDVSDAQLSSQSGEVGFSILSKSTNHIILTRPSQMISSPDLSVYTFDNIVNPSSTGQAFSVRLKSLGSTDGTGPQIDFGSVRGDMTDSIIIETQVPPMLIFCLAEQVQLGCATTNEVYFKDLGEFPDDEALYTQSQMAAGSNATGGFVVTVYGEPPTAGTASIEGLDSPTPSMPGTSQFGLNLVENTDPAVGEDPEGIWANAVPKTDYETPNRFMFRSGDVVAESSGVALMKKFTVSYILNAGPDLHAGVYTTTLSFIASGRF